MAMTNLAPMKRAAPLHLRPEFCMPCGFVAVDRKGGRNTYKTRKEVIRKTYMP